MIFTQNNGVCYDDDVYDLLSEYNDIRDENEQAACRKGVTFCYCDLCEDAQIDLELAAAEIDRAYWSDWAHAQWNSICDQ